MWIVYDWTAFTVVYASYSLTDAADAARNYSLQVGPCQLEKTKS